VLGKNGFWGFVKGWIVWRAELSVLECSAGFFILPDNVFGLGEGGDFNHKCRCGEPNFD
jgi:hypothetical protein